MNDFETRLTEALTSGAEQAPETDDLAAGARRRSRTRRRTRHAVGACAVVAVLAVPVVVLAAGGDNQPPVARDPGEPTTDRWHTVEHEGVLVDVPGGWVQLDTSACVFDGTRYAPRDSDPCTFDHEGLVFAGSANTEPYRPPGVIGDAKVGNGWSGYVNADDWLVLVQAADRDETRRVLGSVREEGQNAPDLSAGWRTETYDGLSVVVPADWREGALSNWCRDKSVTGWVERPESIESLSSCPQYRTGYGVRFGAGDIDRSGIQQRGGPKFPDHSWAGIAIAPDENGTPVGFVEVVAPTRGLAELIGGSLRAE